MTAAARSASDFKPMGERVVVRLNEPEIITQGSIYRPNTS